MKTAANKRSKPRKRTKKSRPWLLLFRLISWLIVAGVLWCGYMLWLINSFDSDKPIGKADAGIVLGAALWNNVPSPALKERLDYAFQLYEEGLVDKLILSGGFDYKGAPKTEAEGMRDYLLAKGITADKLLLEKKATSTYENLLFSRAIAKEHQLSKLLIITHDYHATRAGEMAKQLDFAHVELAGTHSMVLDAFYNESREVLAYTKWKIDSVFLWLGLRPPELLL